MGEAAKFRPEVDLDEFERRLRATAPEAAPTAQQNDPLAELARLVGGEGAAKREDPFEALFRAQNGQGAAQPRQASRVEPQFQAAQRQHEAAPRQQEPAYQQASQSYPVYPASHQQQAQENDPHWEDQAEGDWSQQYEQAPPPPAASGGRKVVIGMVSLLALGVVGIGATLALRSHSGSGDVKIIQADADPAKVKPDTVDAAANPSSSQTLFDRKDNVSVAKVVTHVEQPADLAAATKPPRVVSANGAAGVAVPAAPSGAASGADGMFPPPKKVKTVSVRADGTVISGPEAQPQLARALPPASVTAVAAAHKPAAAKTPTTKPTDHTATTSTTESALKGPVKPKPVKVASTGATPATGTAAAAATAPAAAGAAGAWAVQLAGSPVESEARDAATKLSAKYAGALKGRHATFVQAKVGEKTVYRVRVGHLAKDAATEICTAIKGQGGSCFVTQ
jgi:hypothetical protein